MTEWKTCPGVHTDPDVLAGYCEDASGLVGQPQGLVRARDARDVTDAVEWAWSEHAPVTPVGSRSSTTGSAAPTQGGLVLSLEGLGGIERLSERVVRVGAGVNLGDFKRHVQGWGLLYPPDPTSENDCTIGGTIATNASGPRSLKYGATRRYIRALEVVLPTGEHRKYRRRELEKDTTGYGCVSDPVDWFIGAEGTLGVVTHAEVQLVDAPVQTIALFAYFPTVEEALDTVVWLRGSSGPRPRPDGPWERVSPRCIELFDGVALHLIRSEAKKLGVDVPEEAGAMLFLEQEDSGSDEEMLEAWFEVLMASTRLAEQTTVAENASRQRLLRQLRHHVPATLNEEARGFRDEGGRKISTDWAVPLHQLHDAVREASELAESIATHRRVRYGHIGNGHPHFNLLARDTRELEGAKLVAEKMARMAVRRGGTAAAEHGLGKVKREFLDWIHPPEVVAMMRAMKSQMDPRGLFAPGNLFPDST